MALPAPAGPAGGMMPAGNPMAPPATPPDAPDDSDVGSTTVVTVCKEADGSYLVYKGEKPDEAAGGADLSLDTTDALGGAGDAPAPTPSPDTAATGQSADSIGAALKLVMDILQDDKGSEGMPGNADDQLASGFSASKYPTPAKPPAGGAPRF